MMRNRCLLGSVACILFLSSCYTNRASVTKYDYSYMYDDNQSVINPKFKIFHQSLDSSTLFYEISSGDILYERIQSDSSMAANVKLKYTLYADRDLNILLDSGNKNLANYGSNGKDALLQNRLTFKFSTRKRAWLSIRFRDENKDFNIVNTIEIDKRENFNSQYFNYYKGKQLLFNQRGISEDITIEKSPLIKENDFIMAASQKSFSMTPPPFAQQKKSELKLSSETNFEFQFLNNKYDYSSAYPINYFYTEGDSSAYNPIFYFGESFPKLNEVEQLIDPIRYISTSKEYKNLKTAVDSKKGLDVFWLKLGKNEQNAKELLKEYYSRIEVANKYFTSYKEGWKTDRGIIYIIYGVPSSIRKNSNKEVWLYGEENNVLSVQFRFYKPQNSTVSNHYEMVRNSDYKNNWYRQVDLWRQGKID
jgi:GWxTD domain-containing protein